MSERLTTIALTILGICAVEVITGWLLLLYLNRAVPESMNNIAFTLVGALGALIGPPAVKHVTQAIGSGATATAPEDAAPDKTA